MKTTIRPTAPGIFPYLKNGLHSVALGNGSRFDVGVMRTEGGKLISIVGHGAYVFGHFATTGYVASKLGLLEGDAANIADLINCQVGSMTMPSDVQGDYNPSLLATPEVAS